MYKQWEDEINSMYSYIEAKINAGQYLTIKEIWKNQKIKEISKKLQEIELRYERKSR